jgi:hypothetical protein
MDRERVVVRPYDIIDAIEGIKETIVSVVLRPS